MFIFNGNKINQPFLYGLTLQNCSVSSEYSELCQRLLNAKSKLVEYY